MDFLLLEVFGAKYLPNDIASRIAARRESARALAEYAEVVDRAARRRSEVQAASVEAVAV